jgi:hypothetical protein
MRKHLLGGLVPLHLGRREQVNGVVAGVLEPEMKPQAPALVHALLVGAPLFGYEVGRARIHVFQFQRGNGILLRVGVLLGDRLERPVRLFFEVLDDQGLQLVLA